MRNSSLQPTQRSRCPKYISQGVCSKKGTGDIRRRSRNQNGDTRNSYIYAVSVKKKTIKVCKAALIGLHGIKASRLKRKVLNLSSCLAGNRGKHDNHSKITDSVKSRIRKYIEMFPARESNYSRSKNEHTKYLYFSLTIGEIHRLFVKRNPDFAHDCKYSLDKHIFYNEFKISFGYSRTDICDTCEKQQACLANAKANNDGVGVKKLKPSENFIFVKHVCITLSYLKSPKLL